MTLALTILCLVEFAAIVRLACFAWREHRSKWEVGRTCHLLWEQNKHLRGELDVEDVVLRERQIACHNRCFAEHGPHP